MFGDDFWNHVTLGVSWWAYDERSQLLRNSSGKTESWWLDQYNTHLKTRFHLEKDLEAVFIDSYSQKDPINLEDELQQVAYQRETKKLWDTFSVMEAFEFKSIQDVIEELRECNQLLDGSIDQLQKDMEDRVVEINLLNEDVRNFGIITAKNRHNIVLNGQMILQNEHNIEHNFELSSGLIQTNRDEIEVNSGLIQTNKEKIEVNSGLIQNNKEKIEVNSGSIEANMKSLNVSHSFCCSIHDMKADFSFTGT